MNNDVRRLRDVNFLLMICCRFTEQGEIFAYFFGGERIGNGENGIVEIISIFRSVELLNDNISRSQKSII